MATNDCNADELANALFTSLTADSPTPPTVDFTDPSFTFSADTTSDLYTDVSPVLLADLTEVKLDGEGVFDVMMKAVDLHVNREFRDNRITADQYAEVYTQALNTVLSTASSFLLNKDQAKWQAITAQMEARIAEINVTKTLIELEKAKAETAKMIFDMQNSGAQYALTKMEVANADATHCLIKAQTAEKQYSVEFLLPAELAIQEFQRMQVLPSTVAINQVQSDRILPAEAAIKEFTLNKVMPIERDIQQYQLDEVLPLKVGIDAYQLNLLLPVTLGQEQHKLNVQMPAQSTYIKEQGESQRAQTLDDRSDGLTAISGLLGRQKDAIVEDIRSKAYNVDFVLPIQLDLVKEQREAERAKTLDTRTDNTVVVGSIGKQKDLYTQQIDSFVKDAKYKAAKMYLDGWITQKTLDEGLFAPNELQNTTVDSVLSNIRTANGL
jgi:hypothetical protein